MKKLICLVVAAVILAFAGTVPTYADWGHRGWHHHDGWHHRPWGGVNFYWGLGGWYPWSPWPAYPYYRVPRVIIQSPPVVVQQPPTYIAPQQRKPYYWYYCQSPRGYYPYVKRCPGGWMKVVPDATPPQ